MKTQKKLALLSVSNKDGIVNFAHSLANLGYEIISTGGTYNVLLQDGIPVTPISDITNFKEILDGRVKTLHPNIHAALLAVRNNKEHLQALQEHLIKPIDVVAVNLYPFKETIQNPNSTENDAIENIDIGGPAMLRSSAKNFKYVTVIVDPNDYQKIINEISQDGDTKLSTKKELSAKAFRYTAAYDATIANYLTNLYKKEEYPENLTITYEKQQNLRYGENPHQTAVFYKNPLNQYPNITNAKQIHGKELSFNNIVDADTAISLVNEFLLPSVVAIKHGNPCGVSIGTTIYEAYLKTYKSDPISIFGGIVALNKEVDEITASEMSKTFLEIIIAPSFSEEALSILTKKQSIRILQLNNIQPTNQKKLLSVNGGLLVQDYDMIDIDENNFSYPTTNKPTNEEIKQAKFAFTVVKYIKSNAIAITKDYAIIGIGPGQTSRISSTNIAIKQAGEKAKGSVLASDAFFPATDSIDEAFKFGINVIIQPGGSVKDDEVIKKCNEYGIKMIFTGTRHFRH